MDYQGHSLDCPSRTGYYVSRNRPIELSYKAHDRLRWLKVWQRRLEREGLRGLEDRSRKPKRFRRPQWSPELSEAVLRLREQYPRWGKDKLAVLLKREGWPTSASTVGRILRRLKARGVLREPPRNGIAARKRPFRRPYAVRKPRGHAVVNPGDLVQLDTLDVRPLPGVIFKQFTARDMVCRWDVLQAYRRATANNAEAFLKTLVDRMPFPVRAIQAVSPRRAGAPGPNGVDGGSEFMAQFEQACAQRGIPLFVLPPRSPELNPHVERAQRTHGEEFYDLYMGDLDLKSVNHGLRDWEHVYDYVRPHHSLDLRTPAEYLKLHHSGLAPPSKLSQMS